MIKYIKAILNKRKIATDDAIIRRIISENLGGDVDGDTATIVYHIKARKVKFFRDPRKNNVS